MKLLIIGASGVLGSALYHEALKKKWNVLGTYCSCEYEGLSHLDVRDGEEAKNIYDFFKPETVVLAGGITNVDLCEKDPLLAEDVNIKGTLNVIKNSHRYGSRLIYVSTDYVFDGKNGPYSEEDKTNPVNVYGRTKLEAENAVLSFSKRCAVVRTSQLFGYDPRGVNFMMKILNNMKRGEKINAAEDFYSTPTYSVSLARIISCLIEKKSSGIFNGTGVDFIDRLSYVDKVAGIFGFDRSLINKVTLSDLKLKAIRPSRGGLIARKIKEIATSEVLGVDRAVLSFKEEMACKGVI